MSKKILLVISLFFVSLLPYLISNTVHAGLVEPKGSCCVFLVNGSSDLNECFGAEKNYNCTPEDAKRFLVEKKNYNSATTVSSVNYYKNHNCYYNKDKPAGSRYYCSLDGKEGNSDQTQMQTIGSANNTNTTAKDTRIKSNLSQKGLVPQETGYLMDNCIKDGNCSVCAILATFAYIINWLFKIGVLGAFLMVTYYGLVLLTSAGNENKVKDGKNGIKGTIIGIIVLFSGWIIVDTVLVSFVGGTSGGLSVQETWNRSVFNDGTKWYQFCQVNMKK